MSFVSKLLERLGVVHTESPTPPPAAEPFEPDDFDPEQTQSSLTETTETTAVAGLADTTAISRPSAPPTTRTTTLRDLLVSRGLQDQDLRTGLSGGWSEALERAFEQHYSDAGLAQPEHSWTVERAHAAVQTARGDGLTPAEVRFQVEGLLKEDGAEPRDIAADAAAKDEVLDAVEQELAEALQAHSAHLDARADRLQEQIAALTAERDRAREQARAARNRFAGWQQRKKRVEEAWADVLDVLAPFL